MANLELFNKMAKNYDSDERIFVTNLISAKIAEELSSDDNLKSKTMLDFGCGTGLVGLNLVEQVKHLTFLDGSEQMIAIVNQKIEQLAIKNANSIVADSENNDLNIQNQKFDYIIIVQVLLHIPNTDQIISQLASLLNENGKLIIVDFNKNELVQSSLIHNGFDQVELQTKLNQNNLIDFKSQTFYEADKLLMNEYASMFITTATYI